MGVPQAAGGAVPLKTNTRHRKRVHSHTPQVPIHPRAEAHARARARTSAHNLTPRHPAPHCRRGHTRCRGVPGRTFAGCLATPGRSDAMGAHGNMNTHTRRSCIAKSKNKKTHPRQIVIETARLGVTQLGHFAPPPPNPPTPRLLTQPAGALAQASTGPRHCCLGVLVSASAPTPLHAPGVRGPRRGKGAPTVCTLSSCRGTIKGGRASFTVGNTERPRQRQAPAPT